MSSIFDTVASSSNFENIFDTKTALSGLYLWLLFGFLSTMVNCDIQKLMRDSLIMRHTVGFFSFFLLFTLGEANNAKSNAVAPSAATAHILYIFLKTLAVYGLFLIMIKSKWYFSLPVLGLLIIDQSIKAYRNYLVKLENHIADVEAWDSVRSGINIALLVAIGAGFAHYAYRQKKEFGKKFSLAKLIFSYACA